MRHCYVLRVFTRNGEGGNHLGVVTDVTGIDDEQMQTTAAQLGFSETVFVDWREGPVPVARIFTPTTEIPFAGHPLVGAGWVLNVLGPGADRIRCGIGEIPIHVDGDRTWISVPGTRPVRLTTPPGGGVGAFEVLMPLPYMVVAYPDPEAVAGLDPDGFTSETLAWSWIREGEKVKARFFAPSVGVREDPGTGSAAVALAEVLRRVGMESGSLTIEQGDETGRPCTLHLMWNRDAIRVGGAVVRDEVRVLEV
ncbi:MAG: hypothetical protein KatS3mg011_1713 [Acidimicrobiia bacterium]|nr:MAG: hypothetical protein KatS3mg011_1713 [Acidimicrobiia bacterium]